MTMVEDDDENVSVYMTIYTDTETQREEERNVYVYTYTAYSMIDNKCMEYVFQKYAWISLLIEQWIEVAVVATTVTTTNK